MQTRNLSRKGGNSMAILSNEVKECIKSIAVRCQYSDLEYRADFSNGYGVIIKNGTSWGNKTFWEVAVLKKGILTYDTYIKNGICENATEDEVLAICYRIAEI